MEIWLPIKGYPDYEVSSFGFVRSLRSGIILKGVVNWKGYLRVTLFHNRKGKLFSVHRIVAEAHLSNPEGKPQVNHLDGVKDNNRSDNLEWSTGSENILHAYATGLKPMPTNQRKLTESQVLFIRELLSLGYSAASIGRKFDLTRGAIQSIKCGRTWGWLK